MKELKIATNNSTAYYRLIALWVICEAFLGGIIHGLKLPVSGIVVGSCAVICISLIGRLQHAATAILKATIIVAIFKMMLSPQAPPMAYVAVFFQGLLGQLLLGNRKYFNTACIIFAVLALMESGLQRILILSFVYGKNIWQVTDETISKLFQLKTIERFSILLIIAYLFIHLITGLFAGLLVLKIVQRINTWKVELQSFLIPSNVAVCNYLTPLQIPSKKSKKVGWLILYAVLLLFYLNSIGYLGKPYFDKSVIASILLRSAIILASWYLIIGPLITGLIKSWQLSSFCTGISRVSFCGKIILINTLKEDDAA